LTHYFKILVIHAMPIKNVSIVLQLIDLFLLHFKQYYTEIYTVCAIVSIIAIIYDILIWAFKIICIFILYIIK